MNHLETAFEIIRQNPSIAHFVGPRAKELIEQAESVIGINFPPTYREFLLRLGAGSFSGDEFYGITDNNFEKSTVPNGIWLTLKKRVTINLPDPYIIIYKMSDGPYLCLATRQKNSDGECPVVEWSPEMSEDESIKAYENFGECFYEKIQAALSENI